jgi:hypothetical protein
MYTDTPVPQEEPAGQNPPDGAIINYYLKEKAKEVTLEIMDAKGELVRRYHSGDKPYVKPADNAPDYWVRPQQILSAEAGSHRFIWDLHYTPLDLPAQYPISAIYMNTAPSPTSPYALPGNFTVRLTVEGKTFSQPLKLKMDPRVKTAAKDLQWQHELSKQLYKLRKQLMQMNPSDTELKNRKALLLSQAAQVFGILEDSDLPATSQAKQAAADLIDQMKKMLGN